MKLRIPFNFLAVGILGAAALTVPDFLRAQAPPGPLPQAQPQAPPASTENPPNQVPRTVTRTSILGQWKLNRDESDDLQKKLQDASANSGRRGGSGVSIGGFPGIGVGHGGYGGGRSGESDERLQSVIAPANSLALAQKEPKDPEVDLTDEQSRKRAFFTDGRKLSKPDSKDDSYQEIAAHWDGSRLVSEEKSPRGGKMSRTFELSYDGAQLYETIRLTTGRSNTPLDVRYVYDAVSLDVASPRQ